MCLEEMPSSTLSEHSAVLSSEMERGEMERGEMRERRDGERRDGERRDEREKMERERRNAFEYIRNGGFTYK